MYKAKKPKLSSFTQAMKAAICWGGKPLTASLWLMKPTTGNCRQTKTDDKNFSNLELQLRPITLNKHHSVITASLEFSQAMAMRAAMSKKTKQEPMDFDNPEHMVFLQEYLDEMDDSLWLPRKVGEARVEPQLDLALRPLGVVDGAHRCAIYLKFWHEYNQLNEFEYAELYVSHRVLLFKPDTPDDMCKMVSSLPWFLFAHFLFLYSCRRGSTRRTARQHATPPSWTLRVRFGGRMCC
jgi:hypothetical protein